jgi:hypothetical protein
MTREHAYGGGPGPESFSVGKAIGVDPESVPRAVPGWNRPKSHACRRLCTKPPNVARTALPR